MLRINNVRLAQSFALACVLSPLATYQALAETFGAIGGGSFVAQFAYDLAVDGTTALITKEQVGARRAHLYELAASTWNGVTTLTGSSAVAGSGFAFNCDFAGGVAIVSERYSGIAGHQTGTAYVFEQAAIGWSETALLTASDAAAGLAFVCERALLQSE
ncbi:MAG: hypothetical protein ACI835_000421 [Planctomycetota bacterium]|jgi:hypothetical protein